MTEQIKEKVSSAVKGLNSQNRWGMAGTATSLYLYDDAFKFFTELIQDHTSIDESDFLAKTAAMICGLGITWALARIGFARDHAKG